jgi:hypothetical protein
MYYFRFLPIIKLGGNPALQSRLALLRLHVRPCSVRRAVLQSGSSRVARRASLLNSFAYYSGPLIGNQGMMNLGTAGSKGVALVDDIETGRVARSSALDPGTDIVGTSFSPPKVERAGGSSDRWA